MFGGRDAADIAVPRLRNVATELIELEIFLTMTLCWTVMKAENGVSHSDSLR